ncbi:MAG: DegT/DnrJ/EryC1/StrS family aminotransferase [Bacteroidales bacterium]|nr:DegT/DnrJ/EryC1/StrS family aminotransferase [Bacteroidales bacterium]
MNIKYPVYKPYLNGNEKTYVNECLDSTWISSKGKFVNEFEKKFSDYIGVKYATAVSNGTVALHLALVALGLGEGDEVIVPTLTYIASVNSIAYTGAKPIFVDSEKTTWQLDPIDIRNKITSKTKAIMVVHLYGHPAEMDEIMQIAREYSLFVIEDCAEAFGSTYNNKHVGTFGDIAIFSFFGNKTITTGEGGMVVTNDATLFDRAVRFKGQGLAMHRQYWHDIIGYNYRMTNICAAIGVAQIENADKIIEKKILIAKWYQELLSGAPVEFQQMKSNVKHTYWMVSILLKSNEQRDPIRMHLDNVGIETRPLFYPIHTMPMYSAKYNRHPIAEDLSLRGLNLPSYPELEFNDVKFICDKIKEYLYTILK